MMDLERMSLDEGLQQLPALYARRRLEKQAMPDLSGIASTIGQYASKLPAQLQSYLPAGLQDAQTLEKIKNYALPIAAGAGIGGLGGLAMSAMQPEYRRRTSSNALTGALLGALIGGGGYGAYQAYNQPSAGPRNLELDKLQAEQANKKNNPGAAIWGGITHAAKGLVGANPTDVGEEGSAPDPNSWSAAANRWMPNLATPLRAAGKLLSWPSALATLAVPTAAGKVNQQWAGSRNPAEALGQLASAARGKIWPQADGREDLVNQLAKTLKTQTAGRLPEQVQTIEDSAVGQAAHALRQRGDTPEPLWHGARQRAFDTEQQHLGVLRSSLQSPSANKTTIPITSDATGNRLLNAVMTLAKQHGSSGPSYARAAAEAKLLGHITPETAKAVYEDAVARSDAIGRPTIDAKTGRPVYSGKEPGFAGENAAAHAGHYGWRSGLGAGAVALISSILGQNMSADEAEIDQRIHAMSPQP